jgi:hypothetical protein
VVAVAPQQHHGPSVTHPVELDARREPALDERFVVDPQAHDPAVGGLGGGARRGA